MALINCPECGKQFSNKAVACPNCGYPSELINNDRVSNIDIKQDEEVDESIETEMIFKNIPTSLKPMNKMKQSSQYKKGNRLLGFRSNNATSKIIACIYFIFVIGFFLMSIIPNTNKYQYTDTDVLKRIIQIMITTLMLLSPVIILSENGIREKTPIFKHRRVSLTAFGFIVIFGLTVLISRFINSSMSAEHKASVETYEKTIKAVEKQVVEYEEADVKEEKEDIEEVSESDFKDSCKAIKYKDLMRNSNDYIGKNIVLTVKIVQVMDKSLFDDTLCFRVYTDNQGYGYYSDDEYYLLDNRTEGSMKLLKDDVIKIYGTFNGLIKLTRAIGWTQDEVPEIKLKYAELIEE